MSLPTAGMDGRLAVLRGLKHRLTKNGVEARLIASSLPFEPVEDVGVDASGDLLLERTMEGAAAGALPLLVGHLGDVGGVDVVIGEGGQLPETGALGLGEGRQGFQGEASHLGLCGGLHSVAFLLGSRGVRRGCG